MNIPENGENTKQEEHLDIKEIDRFLVNKICNERKFPHQILIHYTKDLNSDVLKYLRRKRTIEYYKSQDLSKNNAVALPFEGIGFHIVIDEDKELPATTVIHEATHIIDYYEFMINFNNGGFDIENNNLYRAFYCYTEFNARLIAHIFYLENFHLQLPKDIELPDIINSINQFYSQYANIEMVKDFYELMQLLGRWAAVEHIKNTTYELPHYTSLYEKLNAVKQKTNNTTLAELDAEFNKCSLLWHS